jgi:uncharacterized protein with FMN-binding domain
VRRAVPAILLTLLGLGALASFKSSPGAGGKVTIAAAPPHATTTPSTAPPRTNPPATNAPATNPSATNPPATSPPTTQAPATTTRTVDGDPVDNNYGTVQVRVTLRGNQIVDVQPLQMPFDHQRSLEISQQAAPLLRQEVLQAQSANIQLLSGATYTSDSYAQSLQSALDKAGA